MNMVREELIPFAQAREAFPGRKRIGLATLHRWRLQGVRGAVLETLVVGGVRFTSREAIARFIEAQNDPGMMHSGLTADQRQARSAAARAMLQARGI